MKHRRTHYTLLLFGIIIVISLSACIGKTGPVSRPGPALQWSRTFDGGVIDSIQQTKDGGYILCGTKTSYENPNEAGTWLIKTDADGNKLWDKTYNADVTDFSREVQQTIDGGYIICGNIITDEVGNYCFWLIKTDQDGNKLWDKIFASTKFGAWGNSVQQTTDDGYVLCGQSDDHTRLIKTDAEGNTIWDRILASQNDTDSGSSVRQTTDGGYIVCGDTWPLQTDMSADRPNIWLIKTDANGDKLWDKTFGSRLLYYGGTSVQQTTEGGYIVCGTGGADVAVGPLGVLLIKTDANGNSLWEKVFEPGHGNSVQQTTDGGYIICGSSDSSGLNIPLNGWLIKTDADGNKLWDETFDKGIIYCSSVRQTADGGYITCGRIHSDTSNRSLLLKIAPEQ
jgi:hypothetical protein